jgi:uncharacterized membrane protein
MKRDTQFPTVKAHETNIEAVVRLEAEHDSRVPAGNRISEAVARFAGTNSFVILQLCAVALWMFINTASLGIVPVFDPYPFVLLGTLMALEAVLLAAFVLIRQNRMSLKADERSHLDLQINLLAEKETTKIIQLLQRMSRQMGIEEQVTDRESRELSKDTEVADLAHDLRKNLEAEPLIE